MKDRTERIYSAANGLIDRRYFLRAVAAGSGAAAWSGTAAAQPVRDGQPEWMMAPGADSMEYGTPSPYVQEQVKRLVPPPRPGYGIRNGAFTPHHLLQGTITPSGLHFEVNHHGVPQVDPDRHALVIHGMVARPLKLTLNTLLNYATVTRNYFLECAGNSGSLWAPEPSPANLDLMYGLLSGSEWTGVPLATLLDESGADPSATWLVVEGGDSGSVSRSLPIEKALDDSMIALYQNGEPLRPGQGFPMRLLNPGFEGNTNIKWVRSIRLTDKPGMTRFETSSYTDLMPDGKALQFSLAMEVKSVITRPSNVTVLPRKGAIYEVTGIAWSGHGSIRRVEVSADGGRTWADAELQQPVHPKMLTRFRIPWEWSGGPALLQSRATDDRGRVQPSRAALLAARGSNGPYHYNGIHSWQVNDQGGVAHVYA
jgi:sulfane dehydrogenase subunit SoxC